MPLFNRSLTWHFVVRSHYRMWFLMNWSSCSGAGMFRRWKTRSTGQGSLTCHWFHFMPNHYINDFLMSLCFWSLYFFIMFLYAILLLVSHTNWFSDMMTFLLGEVLIKQNLLPLKCSLFSCYCFCGWSNQLYAWKVAHRIYLLVEKTPSEIFRTAMMTHMHP
jgi:fumarate reductase subunit C